MAIRSPYNQFYGVNPHLNSYIQNTHGAWENFYATHIIRLLDAIEAILPPGYYSLAEQSLQLYEEAALERHTPRPDITIFRDPLTNSAPISEMAISTPTRIDPLTHFLEGTIEDYQTALLIYEESDDSEPVCRIELLSPSNKPRGAGYREYLKKRRQCLVSRIPLIEIDYLHQSPPLTNQLPSYPKEETGSTPFMIIVSDPRPTLEKGTSKVYQFSVHERIPVVEIPLKGAEKIPSPFEAAYQATFENSRRYTMLADYAQLPLAFERYSSTDQSIILGRMGWLAQQVAQGQPLGKL